METESYNSLGGTIILLALFAQNYIFGLRYKVTLSTSKFFSKWVCSLILTERANKKKPKEIHSIVWKGHRKTNLDQWRLLSNCRPGALLAQMLDWTAHFDSKLNFVPVLLVYLHWIFFDLSGQLEPVLTSFNQFLSQFCAIDGHSVKKFTQMSQLFTDFDQF